MSAISRIAKIIRKEAVIVAAVAPPGQAGSGAVGTGRVILVTEGGRVDVEYNGRVVSAGQATDEPLFAGSLVYIMDTDGAPVILGSVK